MNNSLGEWKVLPHDALYEVDDGILTVTGTVKMPLMEFPRRMTVVRLRDARTLIFSPIALSEPEMNRIESIGLPSFLVVPSVHHRRDVKIWKDRYPDIEVVAPAGARSSVEEIVAVDTSTPDLGDPDVAFLTVPGTEDREAALTVRRNGGTSLVVSDIIGNMPRGKGFAGWMARTMGYAGNAPKIPTYARHKLIVDKNAFETWLTSQASQPGLTRVIVAHGDVIDSRPAERLRALSA
jgi:hypothetical protein